MYKGIDELHASTVEYEVIKGPLRIRKVFRTGAKVLGRTFTTIQLMYGYLKEGNNSYTATIGLAQETSRNAIELILKN